jgi:hypothetical protein
LPWSPPSAWPCGIAADEPQPGHVARGLWFDFSGWASPGRDRHPHRDARSGASGRASKTELGHRRPDGLPLADSPTPAWLTACPRHHLGDRKTRNCRMFHREAVLPVCQRSAWRDGGPIRGPGWEDGRRWRRRPGASGRRAGLTGPLWRPGALGRTILDTRIVTVMLTTTHGDGRLPPGQAHEGGVCCSSVTHRRG